MVLIQSSKELAQYTTSIKPHSSISEKEKKHISENCVLYSVAMIGFTKFFYQANSISREIEEEMCKWINK